MFFFSNFRSERVKPYSFKNHLSLNENYQEFNKKVQSAIISENVDTPEGGLDALMQAIVCKKVLINEISFCTKII